MPAPSRPAGPESLAHPLEPAAVVAAAWPAPTVLTSRRSLPEAPSGLCAVRFALPPFVEYNSVMTYLSQVTMTDTVKAIAILLLSAFAAPACAHNPAVPTSAIGITLNVIVDGSFSFVFQGQTIFSPGSYTFDVPAGVQEVSGQLAGRFVGFSILGTTGMATGRLGGPQQGTIQSLQGPNPHVDACSIQFEDRSTSPSSQSFRFQFMASTSPGGKCD